MERDDLWAEARTAGCSESPLQATAPGYVDVAVCGAHMVGPSLISDFAAWLLVRRNSPEYDSMPPGGPSGQDWYVAGAAIEVEIWRMPVEHFGSFVAGIPSPLGIGRLRVANGAEVAGFVCESHALTQAADITRFGGWRRYLARG